jgi:hypothetical protein
MWEMLTNNLKKPYMQADCYDPSRMKDHILSMSSLKAPDSNGRKTLGGTDGSRIDEGCLIGSQDSNVGNDSCKLPGDVVRSLKLADDDDDCVELGENELINSVKLDQSKSSRGNGKLSKWGKGEPVRVLVDGSGRLAGTGNCNEELRSSNNPKSTNGLDLVFVSCPKSGGSRS